MSKNTGTQSYGASLTRTTPSTISFERAEQILQAQPVFPSGEEVPLVDCRERILAADITSPIDIPPFAKAAMDGFACHNDDPASWLTITATIAAGQVPEQSIGFGECARIMTGAMVPDGADHVVRREWSEEEEGCVRFLRPEKKSNIIPRGEDLHAGDLVLEKGIRIQPSHIAFLASLGIPRLAVFCRPRLAVITTGSELLLPGEPLEPAKIYNSNRFSLAAQIATAGARVESEESVPDDPEAIRTAVARHLLAVDLLILSGGVSAGDFDYVPAVLKESGVEILFEKVAVQPGMPTLFGRSGGRFVFGLPGNPVSTFMIFEMFIKPLIFRMAGHRWIPRLVQGILREPVVRKDATRTFFAPVAVKNDGIYPVTYHGSAHLHALTGADAILTIPAGSGEIAAGTTVHARLI